MRLAKSRRPSGSEHDNFNRLIAVVRDRSQDVAFMCAKVLRAGRIHGTEERANFVIEARNEKGKTWPILSGVSVLRREEGVQFIDRRLSVRDLVVNDLRRPFHHALNAVLNAS